MPWLAQLAPALLILGIAAALLRRLRFTHGEQWLVLGGLAASLLHLYLTPWALFALDVPAHVDYIAFLIEAKRLPLPSDGLGAAVRHPPAYYIAAAAATSLGDRLGLPEPLDYARHVTMLCHLAFLLAAGLLLRECLPQGKARLAALGLACFWPVGVTMGARISCDILLYAGQAGVLWALLRWWNRPEPRLLCAAFISAGVAMLAKNSGVTMLAMAGLALACQCWASRRSPPALLRLDLFASVAFALICCYTTLRHGWVLAHVDALEGEPNYDMVLRLALHFNPFLLLYDTGLGLSQDSFWNMWLHTLLLGDASMAWRNDDAMMLAQVLWVAIMLYLIHGFITCRGRFAPEQRRMFALMAFFTLMSIAGALYLLLRTSNPNYMDARYAFPVMLGVAGALGAVAQQHEALGRRRCLRIGLGLAAGMGFTSLLLFSGRV